MSHSSTYTLATYTLEDQRRMSAAKNYFAWQAKLVIPHLGARVLELGCGAGNFTGALLDRDLVVAVDANPGCIAELRARFPGRANLHVEVADAKDLSGLARFDCDSVVCLNVLEHVEDDLGALREMSGILPVGGVVVLLVPAFEELMGPIDEKLGHFRRYRRPMVTRLAAAAGFRIRSLRYLNVVGFFGWWLNARVLRRDAQSTMQIAIFDRCVVPVVSRIEEKLPPPFGQSLLAVLEKGTAVH